MALPIRYNFIAANTSYICALQTIGAAGDFVIDGGGWDGYDHPRRVQLTKTSPGFERTISLTSTGDISGVDFIIAGFDIRGNAVSETISGPNNNTVYTTALFYEVTGVSADAAVATATSIGIGTSGRSQWVKTNTQIATFSIGLGITVPSTDLTWSVVQTTQDVEAAEPAANSIIVHSDSNLVTQTASRQGSYSAPIGALRVNIASSTTGTLALDVYQAGIV